MEILRKTYFSLLAAVLLMACDSPKAWDCVQEAGTIKTEEIPLPNEFQDLVVFDNFDVEIVPDSVNRLYLTIGENLRPDIEADSIQDSLVFHNNNGCEWARKYHHPLLTWHTNQERLFIVQQGSGVIENSDSLKLYYLTLIVEDGTGNVNLIGDFKNFSCSSNGISNISVSGKVNSLGLRYYFNDGQFHGEDLTVGKANILQRGWNDIYVRPEKYLKAVIENPGRIICLVKPDSIDEQVSRGGKLVLP